MPEKTLKIKVIIAMLTEVDWLRNVLLGYANQLYKDFDIITTDDVST